MIRGHVEQMVEQLADGRPALIFANQDLSGCLHPLSACQLPPDQLLAAGRQAVV